MRIYKSREPAGPLASREAAKQKSAGSLTRRRARCASSNLSKRRSGAALTQTGPERPSGYLPSGERRPMECLAEPHASLRRGAR
jgi:hypothetical protein